MNILGISAFYHDSAACLVRDGEIVAAAQEERFTRRKHDPGLPKHAIAYCLDAGGVGNGGIDVAVFYEKPLTKFTRLVSTYAETAPRGWKSFLMGVPAWLKDKAWAGHHIEAFLDAAGYGAPKKFLFTEHHHAHAASAFYPSPWPEAAILTIDGVGEWTTSGIACGEGNQVRMLREIHFPHSLGMLYSAFTYFTGFRVNSGEYKLMGLAPYGEPKYADIIRDKLVEIHEDGSIRLDLSYFGYIDGLKMTNNRFDELFGGPARKGEADITAREMDLAASIQEVTEEIVFKMARFARAITGKRHLCMAGGVALNCVANGKLLRSGIYDDIFIQPAAGDAGGALGAALYVWHHVQGQPREADGKRDRMRAAFLGPSHTNEEIRAWLDECRYPYRAMEEKELTETVAVAVAEEKVVGMLHGRMEFGPRSLGNRSILADARSTKMQSYLNLATKFRESFRPFAPICLEQDAGEYFGYLKHSPYMLLVDEVRAERRFASSARERGAGLKEWVNEPRSDVPAITHVDYSARVQTVNEEQNPRIFGILHELKRLTGYSIMVNTSFNVRSEPIVCTPEDAYRCFMRTGIDVLVLENSVLWKSEQPEWVEQENWREEFGLD
jgi:carbamoyltransferase